MKIVALPRIWLLLLVMLAQFAVFETGLRLKGGSEAAPAFQRLFMNDGRIGYRLKPGARTRFKTASFETDIVINSSGTRDEEIGPKPAGERRIVVLGDSLVMSVQVPLQETFCKRLEQRLNRQPGRAPYHYRVINAGVQGYGPVEELLFYQDVASAFEADVVLLTLFVGNDAVEAADNASRLVPADDDTSAVTVARVGLRQQATVWLRRIVRRSMVLQIVRLRARTLAERFGYREPSAIDRRVTLYLPNPPKDVVGGLSVVRECVLRLAKMADAKGARTAAVLMPARLQVNDEDFANFVSIVGQHGETMVRDGATARFKQALADVPVPVFDLLPALYNAPRRSETFFPDTVHLTRRGHEVVAEALEGFLLESGLLAEPDVRHAGKGGR